MKWLASVTFISVIPFLGNADCTSRNAIDCEIVRLVNQERVQAGSPELIHNLNCQKASDFHADDMKEHNFLSHTSSDGTSAADRLRRFGIEGYWGENIAWNNTKSAENVVAQWMRSPRHKRNMLNPEFRSMAAGSAEPYYVQCFSSVSPGN